jgi:biopolymer transport protein ExbD
MRLNDPAPPRRAINLTPLIDVVFLLLVFFMLASTFLKFTTLPIASAGPAAAPTELRKVVLMHVSNANQVRLNGEPVTPGQVAAALNALADKGMTQLIVVPTATAKVQDIVSALAIARRSRFRSITVAR